MTRDLPWVALPVLLPAFAAALLIMLRRHPDLQRRASLAATASLLGCAAWAFVLAADGEVRPYFFGAWPAPYGIVLVLDRLSGTMVLLTALLAAAVTCYAAASGWDARGRHFHPLLQFQLMGVNGAFLTGDLFNLFVFFEVMLIASYGLLLHGGGAARLRGGFHYVAVNLTGSTLFLFAVGLLYAVTGTLNMADLAGKVRQVAPGDVGILRAGALLLLLVFALKAALVPLHGWLPTAYPAASAPAAALFAIMTKVGAYAIIRFYTLVFGSEGGAAALIAGPWILPAALASLVVGALGVLASRRLSDLAAFAVLWSMGSLLVALTVVDAAGLAAALYYAAHSTLVGAALFLLADLIGAARGNANDRLETAPPVARAALLGGLFFVAAVAMTGLPPLSGFLGKLLILDATRSAGLASWIWATVLATSLVVILGFARAGSVLFWRAEAAGSPDAPTPPVPGPLARPHLPLVATAALVFGTVLLSLAAGPAVRHFEATARQLLDPRPYIEAVLGPATAETTR